MGLLDLTGSANQDFTDKEHQIEPAYTVSGRGCRISSYIDRTCLLGTRSGLQDLTGSKHRSNVPITCRCQDSEHKIVHAYNVTGRSCRISRVGNYRSYMPTRHQERTSGSQGFETPDQYLVSGGRCMISRARNTRSYMPTRYPDRAARSHGFGTPDRRCLEGIRKGLLQDLTGKEQQIVNAYEIS